MFATYKDILSDFGLSDDSVINIYRYGSRVYGTSNPSSDEDFIIVVKNQDHDRDSLDSSYRKINATIYSESSFQDKLDQHKISAIECYSLPKDLCVKHTKSFIFNLNKELLRSSISEKASHSWVKAKKKFEVEKDKDIYIGKKSLFHSLRIIDLGIQIATNNKITDFSSSNQIWFEIFNNESQNYQDYKNKYQSLFNYRMTEFRKLAPKEI
jgi:predicted nucleotidyltransferase